MGTVKVQSGGYVRGDGHVVGVIGIRESIVSTMEFELVSFRFDVKLHIFARLNINSFQDVIILMAEKWCLRALKSQFMIVGIPMWEIGVL